jgi:hypothetical protein
MDGPFDSPCSHICGRKQDGVARHCAWNPYKLILSALAHTHPYHAISSVPSIPTSFMMSTLRLWGWQLVGTSNLVQSVPAETLTATSTFVATAYDYDSLLPTASFNAADNDVSDVLFETPGLDPSNVPSILTVYVSVFFHTLINMPRPRRIPMSVIV